jgi:Cu(I)/Ag(I) efflux system protein CusF
MKKKFTSLLLAALAAASFSTVQAAEVQAAAANPAPAAASADMVDGEVRKIDKSAGKITLKHGDIRNLDMPGMTMVFRVKDTAMLDKLKVGDKLRFHAEKADGAIFVTEIEPVK